MRIVRLCCAFVILSMSFGGWQHAKANDDTVTIPYTAMQERPGGKDDEDCVFMTDGTALDSTYRQIEIKSSTGELVGLATLNKGKISTPASGGTPNCTQMGELQVPKSPFYTIYFDDRRYRSFAASDFPLGPTDIMWFVQ